MIRRAIVSVGLGLVTGHASAGPLDADPDSAHAMNADLHFGLATARFVSNFPARCR